MKLRFRRKTNIEKALDLLNDPTAFRITRPGWENRSYVADPSGSGIVMAIPRQAVREPSKYEL